MTLAPIPVVIVRVRLAPIPVVIVWGEAGTDTGRYSPGEAGTDTGRYSPGEAGTDTGRYSPGEAGTDTGRYSPGEAGTDTGRRFLFPLLLRHCSRFTADSTNRLLPTPPTVSSRLHQPSPTDYFTSDRVKVELCPEPMFWRRICCI